MDFFHTIRKKLVLVFLLFVLTGSQYAQNSIVDSLQNELLKAQEDTTRILLINEIASKIYKTQADSAFLLLQEAISEAKELNYQLGLFELYQTLGQYYAFQDQRDEARTYFEKSYEAAHKAKDKKRAVIALETLAYHYNFMNKKRLSIKQYAKALALAKEINDVEQQASVANNMGSVYSYLGVYDTADMYHNQALVLQTNLGNKRTQAGLLMNLGNNAARSNNLNKAIDYYQRSNKIMREIGDPKGESLVFQMMGYSCSVMGQYPVALDYYQKALHLLEDNKNPNGSISCLRAMAEIYLSIEDYSKALSLIDQAYKIEEANRGVETREYDLLVRKGKVYILKGDYETALQVLNSSLLLRKMANQHLDNFELHFNLGICYENFLQLDSSLYFFRNAHEIAVPANNLLEISQALLSIGRIYLKQNETDLAILTLEKAIQASSKSGNKEQKMEAFQLLSEVYENQNNTVQALHYFKLYHRLQDTLFNEENVKQIAFLEAGYEFEKEKQQLAFRQKNEIDKQKSFQKIILIALGIALLFLAIVIWFYRSKQISNQKLSHLNEELSQQNALIEEQKEKLEELDEVKSRFFTNISHEFRTPLTIISGMIDMVKNKPDQWLEKGSEMIKQNSVNLLNLVNQILDLRKLESQNMELDYVQGDIIQYLKYITESYQAFAQNNGIQLHFLATEPSLQMDYDPDKLVQIISNLLSNAIKFTPDGGNIYFQLDQKTEKGNDWLQIRIEDTGVGIPEDQLKNIFDRFYQVDDSTTRKGEGTGIGLALTKELIKLMQGSIDVQSQLGKGTTFLIKLPIRKNAKIHEQERVSSPNILESDLTTNIASTIQINTDTASSPLPSLLIVEDNPDVVQFLIASLEDDYQLALAKNGQEGIDYAIEQVPDLIISDVMMPEKDGYELCGTLKNDERTSHIPIILLTAKADLDSKIGGLEKGADDYISKPFEPKELLARLKNLLEIRLKLQEHYRYIAPLKAEKTIEDEFIQRVRQIVHKNIDDEEFGIIHLCRALTMSRTQVHNKIKALTGKSTSIFIRSIRLYKAKELLKTTNLSVSEIAYEVGFKHPENFSRYFSKEFGEPPKRTRK